LYLTPTTIDPATIFSTGPDGSDGPAIHVSYTFGGTSGRFAVAEIIARVFPAFRAFAINVMKEFDDRNNRYQFGPYPNDTLAYKGKALVEYQTPARDDGLGTYSWMKKSSLPIEGAAMLVGDEHDLALLSIRLPIAMRELIPTVIRQFEIDAAHCPCD
jgi:hypothetical protein